MPIKVYMLDDHMIFREGVSALINLESDMSAVGSSGTISHFKKNVEQFEADLILIDLAIGDEDGTDAIKWLKEKSNPSKVLIFSMHREVNYVKVALENKVDGYILKDVDSAEIMLGIRNVFNGNKFYSQDIMKIIVAQVTKDSNPNLVKIKKDLSDRETQVLKLIVQEKSNHEIADILFISIRTVDTHRRNIMQKIGAKNNVSIVKYALKNGLLKL